jgi:outer membrane protein assembly complex protein YaeT
LAKTTKKITRVLRFTILVAFVLLGIVFAGLLLVQHFFSSFLQDYVRTELGWSLKIGSAEIQFDPLSIRLESIELYAENEKPFLQAKSASARIPYSSFWTDEFLVHQVVIDSPNLQADLLRLRRESRATSDKKAKTFRIENAIVNSGEVQFKSYHFKKIHLNSKVDSQGIRIRELKSEFNDIALKAAGDLKDWKKPHLDVSYEANGDVVGIVSKFPSVGNWKGNFDTHGSVKGDLFRPIVIGRAKSSAMTLNKSSPFSFDGQFKYDTPSDSRPLSLEANFDSFPFDLVEDQWKQVPEFSSTARGKFRYSGGLNYWEGEGDINAFLLPKQDGALPLSGEVYARLRNGSLQIDRSDLQLYKSNISAEGTLSKDQLHMNANFHSSRLKDIAFLSPKLASIPGTYQVQAQLTGAYEDINVRGSISGKSGNSLIEVKGSTSIGKKRISAEFRGNANRDHLKAFIPDLQTGEFEFEGSVQGTWKQPAVTASFIGSDVKLQKLDLQQISGQVVTEGNRLLFHTEAPELRFQADGSYQLKSGTYELQAKLDGSSIESLLVNERSIPVRGNVFAELEAAGNVRRWKESTATVQMRVPELKWKEILFSVPNAEIRIENGVANLNARAVSPNTQMDLNGTARLVRNFPLDLQISGKYTGELLERISKDWKGEGELDFNATVQGDVSNPKLEGKLITENLNVNYLPNNSKILFKRAEVILSNQILNLEGSGDLNGSPFMWNGKLPMEAGDGDLHFEISDLPIGTFNQGANVSGNLKVTGDFQGKGFPLREWKNRAHDWTGTLSITPTDLKLGKNDLTVKAPLTVRIQNRELSLSPTQIQAGDLLSFQGSGNLNLETGEIESSAHLEARIDLLSNLKADIQSSGPLSLDLKVNGTIKKPEYQGTIQLTNASLRIPESPVVLENLNLQASLNKEGLKIDNLEARSGGGVITGGGALLRDVKGSQVWFQGRNVAANYPEGLRTHADYDLKLSAQESSVLLSGDVRVLRSLYEQDFTFRNPIVRRLLAATKDLTAEKQLKNRLKLAVNVHTVQDLQLKNSSAILRAGGNLKVEGSLYKPRFSGSLDVHEGSRIFITGNQYDVEKGKVTFFGSEFVDTNFDITLSTLLRDYQTDNYYEVFIPFGGSTSNIEFKNVRSTPSLSQDQIFSLLTDGTASSDQVGSSGVFQAQLLSFFAGQVLGAPGSQIAKSVGLSRINIQQEGLHSVNDPKTRLMVGKDIGAGFSLIYSFVLNDPDEQTWIATYRYGRNIIGRFIDQDDDTFTASVSHKIPFGKGVKQSSISAESRKKDRGMRVTSVELKNNSSLTEEQIYATLKMEAGDYYDYWVFQDNADDLKKKLQEMGFLYPVIDVREKEDEKDLVSLSIEISPGERSEMLFSGYKVSEKLLSHYKKMWRTGISAVVVQQMIREDLLKQLQLTGHQQASVKTGMTKSNSHTVYSFDVTPGPRFTSVELKFLGAENYDPLVLQNDLGELYRSDDEIFRDAIHKASDFCEKIKMLYAQQGFLKAVVEPGPVQFSSDTRKIIKIVQIKEGTVSQIDSVTVSNDQLFPDSLQSQLKLRQGQQFLPDGLLDDEQKIRNFYESNGHQDVSVQYNVDFSKGSSNVIVQWVMNMGPVAKIASIRIEGNQSTRSDLIMKQSGLKEGDILTQQNESLAQKRLSDLGIFQQTGLEIEETDVPGFYDVVIRVVESKKYEFQYGGRYNTDDKFGAELRFTDFNLFGRAQNLSLYGRSTLELPLFRVDYTLPVTGSFWDRTRFSIFRDQNDDDVRATVSGDLIEIPFVHKQFTFQFQQDYRLWNHHRLIWSFEYGSETAEFQNLTTGAPLEFQGIESLFRAAFVLDRRDDPLNATHGYFYSINGEFAPLMLDSDISYAKNFSQFFYYKKIGKFVWASGVRAGFLKLRSNILTISQKFRTGGSTTLRGFDHNTVIPGNDAISIFFGGDSVFIFNQEIRFPIYKWISGAVFYDAGNVYFNVSDFDPTDLRHSPGFGFRLGAGGFVLRFDLGFNLDPEEGESDNVFHFGIGQAF